MKISAIIYFFVLLTFVVSAQQQKKYTNPILAGFYPDPSICRVGEDYYLVNSTFAYFPGIPIFHSKDLVNWKLIGHVMDRKEQLDLNGLGVSRGIFAPAIRYHKGLFYVTCTLVDAGGNFVVTAKNPEGPWSNPVWIQQINGIDPSLFFDVDGKAFIIYNSVAPEIKPLYNGHRTIRMYEFDVDSLKVKGEEKILVNGGSDISKSPIWIEGPHIFKKDSFYYMIAAEGGTGEQHSEVVFRSRNVDGSYESNIRNPILTQRHIDPQRKNPITSTGHADFVETPTGEWWSVFLGCRPYDDNHYNTGRETFLVPVRWEYGWPVITKEKEEVQYSYQFPSTSIQHDAGRQLSGDFIVRDEFNTLTLEKNWMFLRTPTESWYNLQSKQGFLTVNLRPETVSEKGNPSFIGHRQQHLKGYASTSLLFTPASDNEKAGLLIFQNENHFYYLCKSSTKNKQVIQLFKSPREMLVECAISTADIAKPLFLKIEANNDAYSFLYSFDGKHWSVLLGSVDAKYLSTKTAGGFVGALYAIYSTSSGKQSSNSAKFDWFEYHGNN